MRDVLTAGRARLFAAAAWAVCLAEGALAAATWKGNATGNFILDLAANWDGSVWGGTICTVGSQPQRPLAISNGTFFGGARLHYSGAFAVTNDFGEGRSLENVGPGGTNGNALQLLGGVELVQVSGGIEAVSSTAYKGSYVWSDSCLTLDGPGVWFHQNTGSLWLNRHYDDDAAFVAHPKLIVRNGASLTVDGALIISGDAAYVCVMGQGSKLAAKDISLGENANLETQAMTNLLRIADSAEGTAQTVNVGSVSPHSVLEIDGGALTVSGGLGLGNGGEAASNCAVRITSGGTLAVEGGTAIGYRADGERARLVARGTGSAFTSAGEVSVRGEKVLFSATEGASITVPKMTVHNLAVEGTLNYGSIYLNQGGDALAFTNAAATGTRIEMTASSAIHLFNTHLTLTSGIFMMGDGNGGNAENNALKRDVYVGGTDTWVQVSASNGFWVRGTSTTLHVDIPSEGFSDSHPVFDLKKIVFGSESHRLRVELSADKRLSGRPETYTLFRTSMDNSCQSEQIEWIVPDSEMVAIGIDKSVPNEVRLRVKKRGELKIIIR